MMSARQLTFAANATYSIYYNFVYFTSVFYMGIFWGEFKYPDHYGGTRCKKFENHCAREMCTTKNFQSKFHVRS